MASKVVSETPAVTEKVLTIGEVAAAFRVDPKTVSRWEKAGKITAIRTPGNHRRFPLSQVEKMLNGEATAKPRPRRKRATAK